MKKLLALLMTLIMCLSLAACGGPDKQPAIDAFNKANTAFNDAANLINENLDSVDEELYNVFLDMSDVMKEYKELLEGDTKISQEDLDKMIAWFGETEKWSKDAKSAVEAGLSDGDGAEVPSGGIWDALTPAAIPEGLAGTGWEFAGGYINSVEMEQEQANEALAQYGGTLQVVFENESSAIMVQGGGSLNGTYSALDDGYTMSIIFDNAGSELKYAGVFSDVGGTAVLLLMPDATGMNAIYFTQIDEH